MKKLKKILLIGIGSLVSILMLLFLFLWIKSPGKPVPFKDINENVVASSISKIERIQLGGFEQHLIVRGKDSLKPIMLFLHGGPGSPEFPFMKDPRLKLEENFVMVYWEQRGAGKSYSKDIPIATMTMDQLISDTHDLAELLVKRFQKKKIYLMGHSWGSLLGILTANEYPDLFHAYLGIGQVCNQNEAEKISLEWVKAKALELKDQKAIDVLSKIKTPNLNSSNKDWLEFLMKERKYVNEYGGGMTREKFDTWSSLTKLIVNTKEYTISDKLKFLNGNFFSMEHLWDDELRENLFERIDSINIPVYLFQGKYDYQSPLKITKRFYEHMKAPKKELFIFENSSHSPFLDEITQFNKIIETLNLK